MKNTVYFLGMISLSIIAIATIFKAMHFPGAAILLTLGLGSFALIVLPLAYAKALRSTNDTLLRIVFHTAFIAFSVDFTGMLFKILHWPGASWLLIFGILLPFVLFLPAYIVYHNKRKLKTDLSFFGIVLFMIYLGVFSSLLAMNNDYKIVKGYSNSTQSIADANKFLILNSAPSAQTLNLVKSVEEIKLKLIVAADKNNASAITDDNTILYTQLFSTDRNINGKAFSESEWDEFNKEFEIFKNQNLGIYNDEAFRLIKEIDAYRIPIQETEGPIIKQLPLATVLNVLTEWQNKLLFIDFTLNTHTKIES